MWSCFAVMRDEIETTMRLLGVTKLSQLGPHLVRPGFPLTSILHTSSSQSPELVLILELTNISYLVHNAAEYKSPRPAPERITGLWARRGRPGSRSGSMRAGSWRSMSLTSRRGVTRVRECFAVLQRRALRVQGWRSLDTQRGLLHRELVQNDQS